MLALLFFVLEMLGMFHQASVPWPPRFPLREVLLPQLLEVLTVDGPQLLTPSGTLSCEAIFLFSAFWISSNPSRDHYKDLAIWSLGLPHSPALSPPADGNGKLLRGFQKVKTTSQFP